MSDKVTVAWVHSQEAAYSWFASMLDLQAHLFMNGREGGYLAMRYGSGGIVEARNKVAAQMLELDTDWLFWIDSDMGFKPDAIDRLLEVADPDTRPIVGGLCFSNVEVTKDGYGGFATFPIPTIYKWAKQPDGSTGFVSWHDYPRDELFECDATGSACIIIHRTVFERMHAKNGPNWYTQIPNPATGGLFGEDMSFCIQAREIGVPVYVHTGVKTTHLKPIWLSEVHFDMHRENAERHGTNSQAASAPASARKMNRAERRAAAKAS